MTIQPNEFYIGQALLDWLKICGSLTLVGILVSFVTAFSAYGSSGFERMLGFLGKAFTDFATMHPRRVFAISSLTFKESVRRKALLVFVIFAILFMFGSWFTEKSTMPPAMQVKVHVTFVTTVITWIAGVVVLLLSCWGLPEDIRLRSLHTVVTKPARRCEVVLGRILGFAGVGTLILGVMGAIGYVWIERQVPAEVPLICRVPVYGQLSFVDRRGNATKKGINVGDIVETRGFIEGASKAAAVYKFEIPEQGDSILLESRFEAFRTWKGDMNRSLRVQYSLVKEAFDADGKVDFAKSQFVRMKPFLIKEFSHNVYELKRKDTYTQDDGESVEIDVYKDMLTDGKLTIHVQCLDRQQYIGVSPGDFFIRVADREFAVGYFKIIVSRWMLMFLIVVISVTASTLVKGPVAIFLVCAFFLIGGLFREMLEKIIDGTAHGGGALESIYRMLTHANQTMQLPDNALTSVMKACDGVLTNGLWLVQHVIPDLNQFDTAGFVANGFDIPFGGVLLPSICVSLGYLIPCVVLGYLCLSLRELESK